MVQGRITHQSSPCPSPWGVSFQACIWAPGEQRKHCARASFSLVPLHLKLQTQELLEGPPVDLKIWPDALGNLGGVWCGFPLCTDPCGYASYVHLFVNSFRSTEKKIQGWHSPWLLDFASLSSHISSHFALTHSCQSQWPSFWS